MTNGVVTKGLNVGYGKVVVSDLSFEVGKGQIVALIGPNGAGKSTILKTITRQLTSLGGKIYINDKDEALLKNDEIARQLSMVTTEKIHPELMSAREVVATGRYPYTGRLGILADKDWEQVDMAIKMTHSEDVMNKDFSRLSDGQRQRIMLARAICQEPEIMVLDEPTSFLDIQFKIEILSVIKTLAVEKNMAVIMSVHDLELVPAIADTVIAIDEGKALAIGTPDEIITGDIIEKIYHMPKGQGEILAQGINSYSYSFEQALNQAF